ncbi:hypothetical protein [Deferrisoma palaeochoriense]
MPWKDIENYVRNAGLSLRERYDLPDSPHRFPGGGHARIEISGAETVSNLEVMVREAEKRGVTVHRVISVVKGTTLMDKQELRDFAQLGAENKLEIVVNPMAARAWDNGRQYLTKEGYVSGMRMRGHDMMYYFLRELDRCIEAGIRGFLTTDEGMLRLTAKMRADGVLPKDVKFKISVFAGHGTAAGGKLLEELGADSFNPLADLTLPMLASIRSGVKIPLDVYISLVESMGGFQRLHEAADIARVAAPVYFKIEPGPSEAALYNTWVDRKMLDDLMVERVRLAEIAMDWIDRSGMEIVMNDYKEDLSIPRP